MKRGSKVLAVLILSVFLVSFLSISVIAASSFDTVSTAFQNVVNSLKDPITSFTANTTLFVRTLFFILVFLIINTLLLYVPLFQAARGTKILVSIVVTILAVYFIPVELIQDMLNPYTALGVSLISIIPFILMFMFARYMLVNNFLKKMAWMFYAVILLGMTIYSAISTPLTTGVTSSQTIYAWIYGIASILALAMVFFSTWIDNKIKIGALEAGMEEAETRLQQRIALDRLKEREADMQGLRTG